MRALSLSNHDSVLPAAVWPSCVPPLDGRSPGPGRPSRHSNTGSSVGVKLFVNHVLFIHINNVELETPVCVSFEVLLQDLAC